MKETKIKNILSSILRWSGWTLVVTVGLAVTSAAGYGIYKLIVSIISNGSF